MYKLNVKGQEFDIREDYTIEQWLRLQRWDSSIEENWVRLLSEATGMPMDQAKEIPLETMQVAIGLLMVTLSPDHCALQPAIDDHNIIDFDTMTFGQFVDLEVLLSRDPRKTLDKMIAVLYGAKATSHWLLRDAWPALQKYMIFRKSIYSQYKALFEIDDVDRDSVEEVADQSHAWLDMIMILADEKFLNVHVAVERPMIEALNYLAWRKDQAIKQEIALQKQKQQSKR